ncbi:lipoprotein-releasing ABC transporter permease subunit [Pseudidiomarina taiwanensis]|nr:lipoprotein-releasing ABC transporter permease subunit [Pseudidiomarina taiwanensis]
MLTSDMENTPRMTLSIAAIFIGWRYGRAKYGQQFARFINRFSLAGILLGVAALIIVDSVMNGFEQQLKQRILGVVPQLTVATAGRAIDDWQQLSAEIPVLVDEYARVPHLATSGVIQAGGRLRPVQIQGVFSEQESAQQPLELIEANMTTGSLQRLQPGSYGIIIGQGLATELEVWPGDSLRLIAAGAGLYTPVGLLPSQRQFTVQGIVNMQSEADQHLVLMHGVDAARLLRLKDQQVQALRFYFNDPFTALDAAQQLQPQAEIAGWSLTTWRDRYGELFDAVALEKRMVNLMLALIIAVAAFNIVSALMMVIQDKRRDIALLQTMGMRPTQLYLLFVIQGMSNGMVGAILGTILGLIGSLFLNDILILFGVQQELMGPQGLPVLIQPAQVATIVVAALMLTFIATLYPARKATQTLPAEALRYE